MQSLRTLGKALTVLSLGLFSSQVARAEIAAPEPTDEPAPTAEPTEPAPDASAPVATASATAEPETPVDPSARWAGRELKEPRDTLSGHIVVAGSFSYAVPFGNVSDGVSERDRVGTGLGYGLDLGYGLNGHVVAGVWGQMLQLGDGNDCSDCDASSYAGGAFVRYHLAQGLRFDPWLSYGIGYRTQSSKFNGDKRTYSGLDWMRLQIGGDWYALSQLGFGPLLELSAGNFFSRPSDESGGGVHWQFLVGLRVVLDVPGK